MMIKLIPIQLLVLNLPSQHVTLPACFYKRPLIFSSLAFKSIPFVYFLIPLKVLHFPLVVLRIPLVLLCITLIILPSPLFYFKIPLNDFNFPLIYLLFCSVKFWGLSKT